MTAAVARAGRRYLPKGWGDLGLQFAIWFGFLAVYQVVRGFADHNTAKAFQNGLRIIDFERNANALYELTFQRLVTSSHTLKILTTWTYWNSEFTVVGLAMLWIYFRRHDAFARFRNTILLANVLGLVGYILVPTAPPRMFSSFGFLNDHRDGVVTLAANPYAAMPSLHAADALIVGVALALLCRSRPAKAFWVLWPAWVWFCVMATANHYWVDVLAGNLVAVLAAALIFRRTIWQRLAPA
ncbi:MAG: phosphatase PAP2 family protein [Gaiellaceae bacterium]